MNFFVTIIIAIVLLGMGIALLNKFVGITVDTQEDLDQRTQDRMNELLTEGSQVAIPYNIRTISRGDSDLFAIGVLNIPDQGMIKDSSFAIEIDLSTAYNHDKTEFDRADVDVLRSQIDDWALYDKTATIISNNERHMFQVLIDVPNVAKSGQYIFNVQVLRDYEGVVTPYENIQKIYVTVP